jgi:peroxiredoxin family protein
MANKKTTVMASKCSLEMAYPPLILAISAAATDVMGVNIMDSVEFGGAASWLNLTSEAQFNFFI